MAVPHWIRRRLPPAGELEKMDTLLRSLKLHTVCESAHCPNIGECFGRGTATFMILGEVCTRSCHFCAVSGGEPLPPDPGEAGRVARAAQVLKLRHVVVTSVTRDDLPDGGAGHFRSVVEALREALSEATVEVLTPDFQGNTDALSIVAAAEPDVFNHNVETVERLYGAVRPQASYRRSLFVIARMRKLLPEKLMKSGLMVGLGETEKEVETVLGDLRDAGCDIITIGQYLRPSGKHLPVFEYVPPEQFEVYRKLALKMGFAGVASSPFVRSSYLADAFMGGKTR